MEKGYVKILGVTKGIGEFEGLGGDDFASIGALNCYSATDPVTLAEWALSTESTEQAEKRRRRLRVSLQSALSGGHYSIAHTTFVIAFSCSITALKQITRRRTGVMFSVKSGRYVKGKFLEEFFVPPSIASNYDAMEVFLAHMEASFDAARKLEGMGIPAEDARYLKPEAVLTHVVMSVNGEALLDWLKKRECFGAQYETRRIFVKILREAKRLAPALFKKAGAPCLVGGFCTEGRQHYDNCPRRVAFPHVDDLKDFIPLWKAGRGGAVLSGDSSPEEG